MGFWPLAFGDCPGDGAGCPTAEEGDACLKYASCHPELTYLTSICPLGWLPMGWYFGGGWVMEAWLVPLRLWAVSESLLRSGLQFMLH